MSLVHRLLRSGWIVVLTTLVVVGIAFAVHQVTPSAYAAEAVLVVPSNSSVTSAASNNSHYPSAAGTATAPNGYQGPGLEDEAQKLATTFAGLIPNDQAVLQAAGRLLGRSTTDIQNRLTATNDANTSIVRVAYSGKSRGEALLGATTIARAVSGSQPVSTAIPRGALMLIRLPNKTTTAYTLTELLAVGAVLGIALGLLLVVVRDRANPRIGDARDAEMLLNTPVINARRLTGEVTELVLQDWHGMATRADRISGDSAATVALVPTSKDASPAATTLAARLTSSKDLTTSRRAPSHDVAARTAGGPQRRRAGSSAAAATIADEPDGSAGSHAGSGSRSARPSRPARVQATAFGRDERDRDFDLGEIVRHDVLVLVIAEGTPARRVSATVDLLAELGRAPDAAVLVDRRPSEPSAS